MVASTFATISPPTRTAYLSATAGMRTERLGIRLASVLDDVRLEFTAVLAPTAQIECAIWSLAVRRAITHVECMVQVIVREESLSAKCEHARDVGDPGVQSIKVI